MKIDANGSDVVQIVIHELLHIVFLQMFTGMVDDTLEEAMVCGLDQLMFAYVKRSPKRLREWREAIDAKKAENEEPRPIEELTDR